MARQGFYGKQSRSFKGDVVDGGKAKSLCIGQQPARAITVTLDEEMENEMVENERFLAEHRLDKPASWWHKVSPHHYIVKKDTGGQNCSQTSGDSVVEKQQGMVPKLTKASSGSEALFKTHDKMGGCSVVEDKQVGSQSLVERVRSSDGASKEVLLNAKAQDEGWTIVKGTRVKRGKEESTFNMLLCSHDRGGGKFK
ncbi:hypothetical protein SUGI_0665160 [Cryptomeria japonica]|nr:hypothetical protein SUGI_0665160 [Cryptomeria japonica]